MNPDVEVKMKPTGVGMKPIEHLDLNRDDWKKETGVTDPDAGVKMKHAEVKMKPIEVANPDVEVKMKPTGVGMKPIEHLDLNLDD